MNICYNHHTEEEEEEEEKKRNDENEEMKEEEDKDYKGKEDRWNDGEGGGEGGIGRIWKGLWRRK